MRRIRGSNLRQDPCHVYHTRQTRSTVDGTDRTDHVNQGFIDVAAPQVLDHETGI